MRRPGLAVHGTGWIVPLALAGLTACGVGRADRRASSPPGELRVQRRSIEDVFILSGELRAVRSLSVVTPRSDGPLQIRWLAEDGADVEEGDRLVEFDSSNLIQTMEERRLRVQQAVIAREGAERNAAAETEKKRVTEEKAEIEVEVARIDAGVPREMRPAAEWRRFQAAWHEKQAEYEKARLDREAYAAASRSEIATARTNEEKAGRELAESERSLASMSLLAPRAGIFLVGNFWRWGPEGPRKLQPGDRVWPFYPIGKVPDPGEMEVLATLAEADHGRVAPGMTARCILDTYPGRRRVGRSRPRLRHLPRHAGRAPRPRGRAALRVRTRADPAEEAYPPRLRGLALRAVLLRTGSMRIVTDPPRARAHFTSVFTPRFLTRPDSSFAT